MNKSVKVLLVLATVLVWGAFSWWWYTCGVKGFCDAEYKVDANVEQAVN